MSLLRKCCCDVEPVWYFDPGWISSMCDCDGSGDPQTYRTPAPIQPGDYYAFTMGQLQSGACSYWTTSLGMYCKYIIDIPTDLKGRYTVNFRGTGHVQKYGIENYYVYYPDPGVWHIQNTPLISDILTLLGQSESRTLINVPLQGLKPHDSAFMQETQEVSFDESFVITRDYSKPGRSTVFELTWSKGYGCWHHYWANVYSAYVHTLNPHGEIYIDIEVGVNYVST